MATDPLTIAERAELEELRRRSHLLESLHETVAVTDAATLRITYWNRGAERMLGWTPEEATGRTALDLLQHRYLGISRGEVFAALQRDGHVDVRVDVGTRDGDRLILACHWRLQPGPPAEIVIIGHDITREVRAEQAMRRTEAKFRAFMEHLPASAYVKDADSRLLYVNPYYERAFGTTLAEVQGQALTPTLPEEVVARYLAIDRQVLSTGEPVVSLEPTTDPEGRPRIWQTTKFLIRDASDELMMGGLTFDVTELHRSQELLAEAQQLARLGSIERDLRTDLITCSAVTLELYGFPLDTPCLTPAQLRERIHPEDRERVRDTLARAVEERRSVELDHRVRRPDGTELVLHTRGRVVCDATGQPLRMLGSTQDVTALRLAFAQLEQLDRHKDEFLSVVTHELRTPLNFITGFASILAEGIGGQLPEHQRVHVERILQGADRMLVVINNLLDMSQMAAGQFSVAPAPTEVAPLITEVVLNLQHLAAEQGQSLEAQVAGTGAIAVDGPRLIQVLTNLVGNALKFTPAGGRITVTATRQAGTLRVAVTDTGPGIVPQDRDRLFKRFSQLDMGPTRQAAGTGLGLAISKAIVEAHGGRIGVDSVPGQGASFWFTLPA